MGEETAAVNDDEAPTTDVEELAPEDVAADNEEELSVFDVEEAAPEVEAVNDADVSTLDEEETAAVSEEDTAADEEAVSEDGVVYTDKLDVVVVPVTAAFDEPADTTDEVDVVYETARVEEELKPAEILADVPLAEVPMFVEVGKKNVTVTTSVVEDTAADVDTAEESPPVTPT